MPEYIKIDHATPSKLEVYRMAEILGIDPDAVLGKLVRAWILAAQQHCDKRKVVLSESMIDRTCGTKGFAQAMILVGWLALQEGQIIVVHFEKHRFKEARKRAQTRLRVRKHRERKKKCNALLSTELEVRQNVTKVVSKIGVLDLAEWLVWWNELHAEGLVSAKVDPNKPSMGVQAGWKRVSASAALRDLLKDRAALADQIRNSSFCREEWFRIERLFGGKNKDGEWIIQKLLDGGYRDKTPKNGTMNADPLGNMAFREAYLKEIEQGGGDERERSNDC